MQSTVANYWLTQTIGAHQGQVYVS